METSQWLAIVISCFSLLVAGTSLAITFSRGRYRLKITSETVLVVSGDSEDLVIRVRVVNNGGVSAEVSDVRLSGTTDRAVSIPMGGPNLPVTLAARGGHEVWEYGYGVLRTQSTHRPDGMPLAVRAIVKVGSKTHSQREELVIPQDPDEVATSPLSRRQKFERWVASWIRPTPAFCGNAPLTGDLARKAYQLMVQNTGRRPLSGCKLELFVWHKGGKQDRVPGIATVKVPLLWGGQIKSVQVPIYDDSTAPGGDKFRWKLTTRRGRPELKHLAITRRQTIGRF